MTMDSRQLEIECARHIDTTWHYSWHWPRTKNGYGLTLEGWRAVQRNAEQEIARTEARLCEIRNLLPDIIRRCVELESQEHDGE